MFKLHRRSRLQQRQGLGSASHGKCGVKCPSMFLPASIICSKYVFRKISKTARGLGNVFYFVTDICKSLSFASDATELSNREGALCCTTSHLPLHLSADNVIGPSKCN